MDWKKLKNKKVFIKLKDRGIYSGEVTDVDDSNPNLIWISIIDKFKNSVTFIHSEIMKLEVLE